MENIDNLIPFLRENEYKFKSLITGCHEYRNIPEKFQNKILKVKLELACKMGKLAVTVIKAKKAI